MDMFSHLRNVPWITTGACDGSKISSNSTWDHFFGFVLKAQLWIPFIFGFKLWRCHLHSTDGMSLVGSNKQVPLRKMTHTKKKEAWSSLTHLWGCFERKPLLWAFCHNCFNIFQGITSATEPGTECWANTVDKKVHSWTFCVRAESFIQWKWKWLCLAESFEFEDFQDRKLHWKWFRRAEPFVFEDFKDRQETPLEKHKSFLLRVVSQQPR